VTINVEKYVHSVGLYAISCAQFHMQLIDRCNKIVNYRKLLRSYYEWCCFTDFAVIAVTNTQNIPVGLSRAVLW